MKKIMKKFMLLSLLLLGLSMAVCGHEVSAKTTKKVVYMPMFENNKYMAHAFGKYNGKSYQNSKEAFENAIKQGYKYLETDLTTTSDGKLVCSHGWTKAICNRIGMKYSSSFKHMTRAMFLKQKVNGCHTLDARGLYKLLKANPDVYIELDLKASNWRTAKKLIKLLLVDFKHDKSVLNRCLVQIGTYKSYTEVNKLYHFKYYQMVTAGNKTVAQYEKVAKWCKKHKVGAIALNMGKCTKSNIAVFKKYGMYVLGYTCNNKTRAEKLFKLGVDTICTGTLK